MRRDLLLKLIAIVLAPPEPKPELVIDPLTFVRNLADVAARQSPEHRAGMVAAFGASIASNIADAYYPESIRARA